MEISTYSPKWAPNMKSPAPLFEGIHCFKVCLEQTVNTTTELRSFSHFPYQSAWIRQNWSGLRFAALKDHMTYGVCHVYKGSILKLLSFRLCHSHWVLQLYSIARRTYALQLLVLFGHYCTESVLAERRRKIWFFFFTVVEVIWLDQMKLW